MGRDTQIPPRDQRQPFPLPACHTQGQIGNPEGEDKPNKKKYDPRVWLREAEKSMVRFQGPNPCLGAF